MALWIVATPIGTLGDLSPRAREVLGSAAVIAAEDTRSTRKLLGAVGVSAPPLESLHAHNEDERAAALAQRALTEEIVLVSDAGTPAISDPGRVLVEAAHARGVEIRSVPGPSALVSALAASGFPAMPSVFLGFAPRKGRDTWCDEVLARTETVVIYEAPTRVVDLIERLAKRAPHREAVLARELSKRFETVTRAPLERLGAAVGEVRGECVLVVGPGEAPERVEADLTDGASLKDVARVLAIRWGVTAREAYQRLLALESTSANDGSA